jgi:hypothetical protein
MYSPPNMRKTIFFIFTISVVGLLVVASAMYRNRHTNGMHRGLLTDDHVSERQAVPAGEVNVVNPGTVVNVNGIQTFVPLPGQVAPAIDVDPLVETEMRRIGSTPAIDKQAPGAASVVEALHQGKHPERLSPVFAPTPFDAHAFAQNPQAYLSIIEPGRVFITAQPGPGIPVLTAESPLEQRVVQGEAIELVVRTAASAPVSFTSLDLGIFVENTLAAISVQADAQGIARVHLRAAPGTVGEVSTLAGSPLAAGQVRFLMIVDLPPAAPVASVTPVSP